MAKLILVLLLISAYFSSILAKDWWETASFYQIYPRSFKDSDGDGIGDLNGITQKLPYLKDIGIDAFWLSPIFKSPMVDFGYDISNFYEIQPEYGTMQDFERLVAAAKTLGIKVILDFVPNHSSDQSEFFKKSVLREEGYEDFYMWHPGKPNSEDPSKPLPPCNWLSVFRYTGWKWNDVRKEYYYHAFVAEQPDLNYRNPKVVAEMKNVLRFWLGKGVAGFRIDAVPNLFEVDKDASGNYPDEPKSNNSDDPDDPLYFNHIYTQDQPETVDMVYQWRAVMDEYQQQHGGEARVIMTETYSPIDVVMQYYGNQMTKGAHIPFNFQLIINLKNSSNAEHYKTLIDSWLTKMPSNASANWVLGNHDQKRIASRYGTDRIDAINMILSTLPGVSITYNGEEIGMTDVWISWADTVDPAGCNTNPNDYNSVSRDPARTPFQWDDTTSSGFSTNAKPWLPVAVDYKTKNVKTQSFAANSYLKTYKDLRRIRNTNTLKEGSVKTFTFNGNVLVILRELQGSDAYVTVANLGGNQESINLSTLGSSLPNTLEYIVVDSSASRRKGATVSKSSVVLKSHESFVLRSKSTTTTTPAPINPAVPTTVAPANGCSALSSFSILLILQAIFLVFY